MRNPKRRPGLAALFFVLAVVLCSCGSASEVARESVAPSAPSVVTVRDITEAFGMLEFDYTDVESAEQLAKMSDILVTGELETVAVGRLDGATSPEDPVAPRNAAMKVRVTDSHKGSVSPGDTVWIELFVDPSAIDDVLPVGLRVQAYLVPAKPSRAEHPMSYEGSSVPPEEPLWYPAHPQGLVFWVSEAGDTGLIPFEPLTKQVHALPIAAVK